MKLGGKRMASGIVGGRSKELMRKHQAIFWRYDNQELIRVGGIESFIRKEFTPKQKRRMNKKLKYRAF